MGRLQQVFTLAFLLAVLAVLLKVLTLWLVFMGSVFYWLCLYPLYIAFYIGLYPLIWIVKKVF